MGGGMRTACRQWDKKYANIVDGFAIFLFLITFGTGFAVGLLGRRWWWAASPRLRIFLVALACYALVVFFVVWLPRMGGLGHFWFSDIPKDYMLCSRVEYESVDLFWGLVGARIQAFGQVGLILSVYLAISLASVGLILSIQSLLRKKAGVSKSVNH